MKNDDLITGPTPKGSTPLPAFPAGPDCMDTSGLRALIPLMLNHIQRFFTGSRVKRGVNIHIRTLYKLLRQIYRTERENYTQALIRALRRDPDWQWQVKCDLGGHRALQMWRLRQDQLRLSKRPHAVDKAAQTDQTSRQEPKPRAKKRAVKTDRYGLFRLAPVTQRASITDRSPPTRPTGTRHIRFDFADPGPVTPDDLIPRHTPDTNHPTSSRHALTRVWREIQTDLRTWGFELFFFDLDSRDTRIRTVKPPP